MNRFRYLLILPLLFFLLPLYAQSEVVRIIEQKGDVKVTGALSDKALPAMVGQTLHPGDTIITGPNSHVILLLADGNRIDLYSNSKMKISKKLDGKRDNLPGFVWKMVHRKIADSEYTGAQAGRAGALRGPADEPELKNRTLSKRETNLLGDVMKRVDLEKISRETKEMTRAIVLEEYEQYQSAEKIYLQLIEKSPQQSVYYDMLVDLYIKNDLYNHAKRLLERKNQEAEGQ